MTGNTTADVARLIREAETDRIRREDASGKASSPSTSSSGVSDSEAADAL